MHKFLAHLLPEQARRLRDVVQGVVVADRLRPLDFHETPHTDKELRYTYERRRDRYIIEASVFYAGRSWPIHQCRFDTVTNNFSGQTSKMGQ